MTRTFADLQTGDTFDFADHVGHESWEKTGPHEARVINSEYTRNVDAGERVNVLYAAVDRGARLRQPSGETMQENGR